MKLNKKDIEHIANLARLDLSNDELKKYGDQLSGVLNYIEQLKEVDVKGVEPTAQVTGLVNVLREDKIEDWDDNERQEALNQSPEMEDNQIKVKKIL